jgi:hypothetical protein
MAELTLPDRNKNQIPISQMHDEHLAWWAGRLREDLEDPAKEKWADSNQKKLAAVAAEIERRAQGGKRREPSSPRNGAQSQQAQSQALARRDTTSLVAGGHSDAAAVTAALHDHAGNYHLVSPSTSCEALPEGCGVAISLVVVDMETNAKGFYKHGEVYKVGSKVGLSGFALDKIAAAAGLSWDPRESGRLDNGADPNYCHYRAVGRVRNFDGSERVVFGEVEIDAREGSPQIEEIRSKAIERQSKNDYKGKKDNGDSQILELRKFLLRHAESKAKNRAIADMGVKRSYDPEELQKPFAVARLMWTGQSKDPELQREFALMHAAHMMGATGTLYGGATQQPRLPAPAAHPMRFEGHAAPPVGSATDPDFDVAGDPPEGPY